MTRNNDRHASLYLLLQLLALLFANHVVHGAITPGKDDCRVSFESNEQIWTHLCINEKCQRLMTKESVKREDDNCETTVRNVTSYNACKLFCGKATGTLWPLPTGTIDIKGPAVPVNNKLTEIKIKFDTNEEIHPNAKQQFEKLSQIFKEKIEKKIPKHSPTKRGVSNRLVITAVIKDPNHLSLGLKTDESYTINFEHDRTNEAKALVTSENFYGFRHGLETLTQLIVHDNIENILIMPWNIYITDKPAYPYRGLTLDTSRNFITVESIKRTIDGMAANKLNVFHWHVTDTHSFPIELPHVPNLSRFGAYGPDKVYKPSQVKDIVEYAKVRGVKVVPEFDAPAHVGYGWQQWAAKPLVVCLNEQPWNQYCVEAPCGQFDPTQEQLYTVLHDLYKDFFDLFGIDSLFHMGGDEVHFQCWNRSTEITEWMKDRGWKTDEAGFLQLWNYFQQRALEIVMTTSANAGIPKSPDIILWTSHLTTGNALDKYVDQNQYIIQIWTKGQDPNVGELISKGYRVIFSNYDALYLDCGFGSWVSDGNNWCSPYIPWQTVYMNDPLSLVKNLTGERFSEDMKNQILGQVATLWTEQVDDQSVDSRFWPRASALAERTWTDPATGWKEAEYRFLYQKNRLADLDIKTDGQEPYFCSLNEGSCPVDPI